jgi:hypothetical protein
MANIKDLLARLSAADDDLLRQKFLAPCLGRGNRVQTKVNNLIYTFAPQPEDFAGWGVFQPRDAQTAAFVEEPAGWQISEYLNLFPALRIRLAFCLGGQTWLAFPVNQSDFRQRFARKAKIIEPIAVHLTTEGRTFETAIVRKVGALWLFEEIDRRAEPEIAERLRESFKEQIAPENLQIKNLTPEQRVCYSLVLNEQNTREARKRQKLQNNDENRLRDALRFGGGELVGFETRGDYWLVEWTTSTGEPHTSAIAKDLSVVSAGICLSDEDDKFDLQSLVRVVERAWEDY